MSKIRIAFFISNLGQGGAEKQFVALINSLDSRKFEKHLFLYAYQKEAFYQEILGNTDVTVVTNKLQNKFPLRKILEAGFYIKRQLKDVDYDVVVSTLFMNNFLVRLFAPQKYRDKFVANVRTSLGFYTKWHVLGEKIQIKKSYLVFNSLKTQNNFRNIISPKFHSRLHLIYNGFEVPNEKFEQNHGIIFGCLGRSSFEKNLIQAVRIFQQFETPGLSSKLIIQGNEGNQHAEMLAQITSKNISIKGKDTEIDKFFQSIRVLIIPSLFEGCPNVLFEALLRRRICIISKGANSDNFIENGLNGFVYDGSDASLLDSLQKVTTILGTPKETEVIEVGYNYALQNFSIENMVKNYERLFLQINESN